jgi:hypothetical protein
MFGLIDYPSFEGLSQKIMQPAEFLKTIYLGDRACKSIALDGWNRRVVIEVDEISRIRSKSGNWDFYNEENIVDGRLVFSEVRSVLFDPAGPLPNDYISGLDVSPLSDGYFRFEFSAASGNETPPYKSKEVSVLIEAKRLHLEDPAYPEVVIDS